MNHFRSLVAFTLFTALSASSAQKQQTAKLGDNAALRYWAAFAQMEDSAITADQAKTINSILDGSAPYDDRAYKDLLEKNKPALEIMARATALPNCDWGLDYEMGSDTPQEFVRRTLILGRLNVLYAMHLLAVGDKEKTVSALAAGLRFSHDVANGGTLFATLVAKTLLVAHLRTIAIASTSANISSAQRSLLRKAVAQLGPDALDWQSAMRREFEIPHALDPQATSAMTQIIPAYIGALSHPSALLDLQKKIANAPRQCSEIIPNPERVLQAKQELTEKLREARSALQ
jgi:hypothetical protein